MKGVATTIGWIDMFRTVNVRINGVLAGRVRRLSRRADYNGNRTMARNKPVWFAAGYDKCTEHKRRGDAIRALVVRAMARTT